MGLPALMKTIDERLQNAIPAVLGKPRLTDPVFCLARVYEIEQGDVLPLQGAREVNARGRSKHLEDPGDGREGAGVLRWENRDAAGCPAAAAGPHGRHTAVSKRPGVTKAETLASVSRW